MNADGFIDVCALGGGHTKVWLGDGQGNWTEAADITTPSPGYYQAFRTGADFDHNGLPDIAFITDEGSWPSDHNVAHAFRESSPYESLTVFPVFPRGGEKFANGSVQFIDWWSEAPSAESTRVRLDISLSSRNGPWTLIADSLLNAGRYQWLVPHGWTSGDCYVKYMVHGPRGIVEGVTPRAFAIGDTVPGVAENHKLQPSSRNPGASMVRGVLFLPGDRGPETGDRSALMDASGRDVLVLRPGANDVRALAPGVYFVRQASSVRHQASSVRKVVVTR
jgi:hypothetical protein